jgi:tight adherence protein B
MRSPLAAILALLALALLGLAAWLVHRAATRRLRDRVRQVAQVARAGSQAAKAPPAIANIRAANRRDSALTMRVLRLLRYDPEIPNEKIVPWPVAAALAGAVGTFSFWRVNALLGGGPAVIGGMLSAFFTARGIFLWQHRRYCDALFVQIPDALGLVLRAIRAGLPMGEALRSVARESASPTRDEFARLVGETAIGRSVDSALWRLYERTQLTEYSFLSVTLGLQSQSGGSLAETLENLADMVRKRVAMRGRARALASEARASAVILVALPFVCGAANVFIRPEVMRVFWADPRGFQMLMAGLCLMVLGVLTIRSMISRSTRD